VAVVVGVAREPVVPPGDVTLEAAAPTPWPNGGGAWLPTSTKPWSVILSPLLLKLKVAAPELDKFSVEPTGNVKPVPAASIVSLSPPATSVAPDMSETAKLLILSVLPPAALVLVTALRVTLKFPTVPENVSKVPDVERSDVVESPKPALSDSWR